LLRRRDSNPRPGG